MQYKGVQWSGQKQKWIAYVHVQGVRYSAGSHLTDKEAARSLDRILYKLYTELGVTVVPNVLQVGLTEEAKAELDGISLAELKRRVLREGQKKRLGNLANGKYKGVCVNRGRWVAYIQLEGQRRNLGGFSTPEEAAMAADLAFIARDGSDATLNFPDRDYSEQLAKQAQERSRPAVELATTSAEEDSEGNDDVEDEGENIGDGDIEEPAGPSEIPKEGKNEFEPYLSSGSSQQDSGSQLANDACGPEQGVEAEEAESLEKSSSPDSRAEGGAAPQSAIKYRHVFHQRDRWKGMFSRRGQKYYAGSHAAPLEAAKSVDRFFYKLNCENPGFAAETLQVGLSEEEKKELDGMSLVDLQNSVLTRPEVARPRGDPAQEVPPLMRALPARAARPAPTGRKRLRESSDVSQVSEDCTADERDGSDAEEQVAPLLALEPPAPLDFGKLAAADQCMQECASGIEELLIRTQEAIRADTDNSGFAALEDFERNAELLVADFQTKLRRTVEDCLGGFSGYERTCSQGPFEQLEEVRRHAGQKDS